MFPVYELRLGLGFGLCVVFLFQTSISLLYNKVLKRLHGTAYEVVLGSETAVQRIRGKGFGLYVVFLFHNFSYELH